VTNDLSTTAAHREPPLEPRVPAASPGGRAPNPRRPAPGGAPPWNAREAGAAAAAPAVRSHAGPGADRGHRPGQRERTAQHSPEPRATRADDAREACPPSRASSRRGRAFGPPPLTATPAPRLPRLLAVGEVAELLTVSTKTMRRWIARRELPVHHLSRQLRVSEEDLAVFLGQRRK
jgi:excisionase family DNA binding protein